MRRGAAAAHSSNTPYRAFTIHTGQPNRYSLGSRPNSPRRRKRMKFSTEAAHPGLFHRPSPGHPPDCLLDHHHRLRLRGQFRRHPDLRRGLPVRGAAPGGSRGHRRRQLSGGHGHDSRYANLYVANAGDGTIVHFAIGLNGELTKKESASFPVAPGPPPASVAVNRLVRICMRYIREQYALPVAWFSMCSPERPLVTRVNDVASQAASTAAVNSGCAAHATVRADVEVG